MRFCGDSVEAKLERHIASRLWGKWGRLWVGVGRWGVTLLRFFAVEGGIPAQRPLNKNLTGSEFRYR